jgi:hypothetical protein
VRNRRELPGVRHSIRWQAHRAHDLGPLHLCRAERTAACAARARLGARASAAARAISEPSAGRERRGRQTGAAPRSHARSALVQWPPSAAHQQHAPGERARELSRAGGQKRQIANGVRSLERARPLEEQFLGHGFARAPNAAHVDHRLQRNAGRRLGRRHDQRAARVRANDPRQGRATPAAHQGPAGFVQARERHDEPAQEPDGHPRHARRTSKSWSTSRTVCR